MGFFKSHKRSSRWYKCFKRERHEDFPFEPVPCLKNGGKESNINVLRNNFLMALSDDDNKLTFSNVSDGGADPLTSGGKKLSKSRRSLSRAFKAVLFPSAAAKKNRSKKTEQEKSFRSLSNDSTSSSSSKLGKMLKSFKGKKSSASTASKYKDSLDCGPQIDSSSSNESSIFSSNSVTPASSVSSSRTSSVASNSRSPSERKKSIEFDFKQLENRSSNTICSSVNRYSKLIIGLFLLLICLAGLTLCGKALAVFCTSACLFLVPCRFNKGVDHHHRFHSVQNDGVDSIDIDSDEHKKKVIMEGFLERSRTTRVLI